MNPTVLAIQKEVKAIIEPFIGLPFTPSIERLPDVHFRMMTHEKFEEDYLSKIRQYYQFHYPQHPFLTEGDVQEICLNHGLSCGYLPQYSASIPEKNKKDIDNFQQSTFRAKDKRRAMQKLSEYSQIADEVEFLKKYQTIHQLFEFLMQRGTNRMGMSLSGGTGSGYGYGYDMPVVNLIGTSFNAGMMSYFPISDKLFIFVEQRPQPRMEVDPMMCDVHMPMSELPPIRMSAQPVYKSRIYLGLQIRNFYAYIPHLKGWHENSMHFAYKHDKPYSTYLHEQAEGRQRSRFGFGGDPFDILPMTENLLCVELPDTYNNSFTTTISAEHRLWGMEPGEGELFNVGQSIEIRLDVQGLNYAIRQLYGAVYEGDITGPDAPSMKIIAPEDHFMRGLQTVGGYRLRFSEDAMSWGGAGDDPIVLQPVPYGYLMLTQWGDDVPHGTINQAGAN